jgi:hypothetical protein
MPTATSLFLGLVGSLFGGFSFFFSGGAFSDFQEWRDQLHCFGLDFRDLSELERFCAFLKRSFARLDIIINNACQVKKDTFSLLSFLVQKYKF